mgnify:CR=1 FL=1
MALFKEAFPSALDQSIQFGKVHEAFYDEWGIPMDKDVNGIDKPKDLTDKQLGCKRAVCLTNEDLVQHKNAIED